MATEIITREDLSEFRTQLLQDIKQLFQEKPATQKSWLKSKEVKQMLNVSAGTLQNLRVNGTLSYTKIGGIIYYAYQDIEKVLQSNRIESYNH